MKLGLRLIPLLLAAGMAWSTSANAAAIDRPDAWITLKAKLALMMADDVDGTDINVDTINHEVSLFGTVESEAAKQKAVAIVRDVEGVTNVREMLSVNPDGDDDAMDAKDEDLEDRVEELLERQERDGFDVEVESVENGVVVLEGEVDSFPRQVDIIERVQRIPGVRHVENRIEAPDDLNEPKHWIDRDYDPSLPATAPAADLDDEDAENVDEMDPYVRDPLEDVWITTMVKSKLLANGDVPALEINVDTWNGEVTLFGTVNTEAAKRAAEAEARSVDDVRNVHNELQVVTEAAEEAVDEEDDAIEERAEEALDERDDLDDIEVEVENGVARLTGEVDTMMARLSAATLVRSLPGVKAVLNDVRVEREAEEE